jgi:uncharacterized protein with WD repeat
MSLYTINNLPQTKKIDAFNKKFREILKSMNIKVVSLYVPTKDGMTLGYAFVELKTIDNINQLDRITFASDRKLQIGKHIELQSNTLKLLEPPSYNWMADINMDQFMIMSDDSLMINSYDSNCTDQIDQTDSLNSILNLDDVKDTAWSSLGTYLIVKRYNMEMFKQRDGSNKFDLVEEHENGVIAEFSPRETYLVIIKNDRNIARCSLYNQDGQKVKELLIPVTDFPVIKWSYNEKYMAMGNELHINQNSRFTKLSSHDNISFSPKTNNMITYTMHKDRPSTIMAIQLPKKMLVSIVVTSIVSVDITWNDSGNYAYVQTREKDKDNLYIISFKSTSKSNSYQKLEFNDLKKYTPEPYGDYLYVEANNKLYSYNVLNNNFSKATVLDIKVEKIKFAPFGQYAVLLYKDNLTFFDTHNNDMIAAKEHYDISDFCWDPSGRYIISHGKNDYTLWSLIGEMMMNKCVNNIKKIQWRPRHNSLDEKEILNTRKSC